MLILIESLSLKMLWMIDSVLHDFHSILDFLGENIVHVEAGDKLWNEEKEPVAFELNALREFDDEERDSNDLNHNANEHSLEYRSGLNLIKVDSRQVLSWEVLLPLVHNYWVKKRDECQIENTIVDLMLNSLLDSLLFSL